jgi:hypothetical protein
MTYADAPRCPSCGSLHRVDVPCWRGTYSANRTRACLARYGRTCWLCGLPGARTADHVVPRSAGGGDDLGNLRPAHRGCNSARGNTPAPGRAASLVVVTGPPGSGKTTHVREHAVGGDVVIDLDALVEALSPPGAGDPHHAPDHVRRVAQRARSAAIQAAYRLPAGLTVWVIHTAPDPEQRADYLGHGATFRAIDPGHDVTLAQAIAAGRPPEHLAVIERHYRAPDGHRRTEAPAIDGGTPPPPPASASRRFTERTTTA